MTAEALEGLTQARVVATFAEEKGRTAMMPSLFWAALAGAALLGGAAAVNMLFGRELARTRASIFALKRLSESTRRLNDAAEIAVIAKEIEAQPAVVLAAVASSENESGRPLRSGE